MPVLNGVIPSSACGQPSPASSTRRRTATRTGSVRCSTATEVSRFDCARPRGSRRESRLRPTVPVDLIRSQRVERPHGRRVGPRCGGPADLALVGHRRMGRSHWNRLARRGSRRSGVASGVGHAARSGHQPALWLSISSDARHWWCSDGSTSCSKAGRDCRPWGQRLA